MKNEKLNIDELSLLKGGIKTLSECFVPDVNNINTFDECGCIYNNSSTITNTNTADRCACVCM